MSIDPTNTRPSKSAARCEPSSDDAELDASGLAPGESADADDLVATTDGNRRHAIKRRMWRPNARQVAYLELWLDPTKPRSPYGLAPLVPCNVRAIYQWLHTPDFLAWFNAEVERNTEHLWLPILHKCSSLALAGSIEHAKLVAMVRGALRPGDDGSRPAGGVTVIVGVPRAGDAAPIPVEQSYPALPALPPSPDQ